MIVLILTLEIGRRINTSPTSIDEPQILNIHLVDPPVRSIDLHLGNNIVVRTGNNRNGVTIKDAMNAIYKQFKKKVSYLEFCFFR